MKVAAKRRGRSLAVRIPNLVATDVESKNGSVVKVRGGQGRLVVTQVSGQTFRLAQLLAGITRKNRHGEVGTGVPVGHESW